MHRFAVVIAAAVFTTAVLSTVPAVGGYSNTSKSRSTRERRGDFTTVGIVTQVEGGAFSVASGQAVAELLAAGKGVLEGDKVWVEHDALVRITDTDGGRITIAGPSAVEFTRGHARRTLIQVYRGSVKFKASDGQVMRFESALVAGVVAGEGALWISGGTAQVLGLAGDVRAWHPRLINAAVLVTPGYFTEASSRFKHLQPQRPMPADAATFQAFLSRFDEPVTAIRAPAKTTDASTPIVGANVRGSRAPADVIEAKSGEDIARLRARMFGEDFEDSDEVPLAVAGPRLDAYGNPIPTKGGRHIAEDSHRPRFEIVKKGKKLDREQELLIKSLTNGKH